MLRSILNGARRAALGTALALGLGGYSSPAKAFLDTQKAWNDLLQFAVRQVNAPGEFEIELGQVTRPEDGFALIESLRIKDSDGFWLDARSLRIDWNPSSLLRGRFAFETLSAEKIQILRAPIARTDAPADSAQIDFAWPRPPVSLVVEKMRIDQMIIEGGLLPQDLRAEIQGRFYDLGDVQEATLSVKRLDRPGDTIDLGSRIDFDDLDISFSLEAHEAPGGLVGQSAGLPETEALELTLAAAGTPASLPFTLYADIGQIGIAEGEGIAQWQDKQAVTFDGFIEPGEKTAQQWRDALGARAEIKLDAEQTSDGGYRLNALEIDSRAAQLSGKGIVDTTANTIDMAFDWSAKDVEALNEVIAPARVSAINGSAKAIGQLTAPKVDVNATVRDLDAAFGKIGAMDLRIDSAPEGSGTDTAGGVQGFSIVAKAQGLALADIALQDALGPSPTLEGSGAFYGNDGRVALEKLTVKAATLDLVGNADYDIDAASLNAELSGAARKIGPFLKGAGVPIDGAATIALKIQNLTATAVERLFLNAQLTGLSSDDPNYAALVGETAVLEALLVEADPGVVKIDRGFFESATLRAEATGSLSIPNDTVDLAFDWRLIDPSRIAPIITPARVGSAQGKAVLKGTLSEPNADIESTLTDVSYPGYSAAKVDASTSAQLRKDRRAPFSLATDLEGFRADDPTLSALVGAEPRIVTSGIFDTATSLLTVGESRATIAAGALGLAGDVNLNKQTLAVTYDLKSTDLDAIGAAAGVALGGSVEAQGSVNGSFTAPVISTRADMRNLRYNEYAVEELDLDVTTETAQDGAAPFSLDLTARNPSLGDPELDALIGNNPHIQAKGSFNPEGPRVLLETFDAALASIKASASGSVDVAAQMLDLEFDLDATRLDGLSAVLGTDIAGALTAKGRASGSFTAPELDAALDGSRLRFGDYSLGRITGKVDVNQSEVGYAPFDIDVVAEDVDLGDPALNDLIGDSATIKARGAYNQADKALRLTSAAFDTAAVTGTAKGSVDLSAQTLDLTYDIDAKSLEPFGVIADIDLAGAVSAKGSASGTFTAPQLDTTITGRELRYDQFTIAAIDGKIDVRQAATGFAPFDIDVVASGVDLGDPALNGLVGEKASIVAEGGYNQSENRLRIDGLAVNSAIAKATAKGSVDLGNQTMNIDFSVDAASLAPLEPLVGEKIAGSVQASGKASGSFAEPRLSSTASARNIRFGTYRVDEIGGRVGVNYQPTGMSLFDVDLSASGVDLGDPAVNAAIGDNAKLIAKGGFDQEKQFLRLEQARAVTAAASASASGTFDVREKLIDIDFDVDARTLDPFSVFVGTDLGGSLRASGHASGPFTAPEVQSTLTGRGLRYDRYSVAAIDGRVSIPQSTEGLAPFSVDVAASGIDLGDPSLNAIVGESAALEARGQIDQGAQLLQLDSASLSTRAVTASAAGEIDLGGQTLDISFNLDASDIAGAASIAGVPLGGALKANGSVRGPFATPLVNVEANGSGLFYDRYSVGSLDLNLDMQGEPGGLSPFSLTLRAWQPRMGDPGLDSLLGEEVSLVATGTLDQASQRVRLDDATARAAIGAARIIGNIDLREQMLDLGYVAQLPDIGMLQPMLNKPLGGGLSVDGKLIGPFSDPASSGVLSGSGIFYDTYQLGGLTARYNLERLVTGPSGEASIEANTPQGPLTASAAFDLTGGVPRIDRFSVDGIGLTGSGSFRSAEGGLYEGEAVFNATDLAPLGALIGQEIAGTVDGSIRFNPQNGQQFAAFDLSVVSASYAQEGTVIATVSSLDVKGQVSNALSADPYIDGTASASQLVVMGFPVQQLLITAQGPLSGLNTTIAGTGGVTGSERIDAAARLTLVGFPRGADLSRFSLSYKGANLTAAGPFRVQEVPGGGWRAENLNLRLDDGEIVGSGEYSPNGVVANLRLRNVPLQLAQLSGFDLIQTGRLAGHINIDTRNAPRGDFALTATVLRLKGAQLDDPFDLVVEGTLDGQALNANARMTSGLIQTPFVASARIPLMSATGSPFPLPDMNAPFNAAVDWSGDVSEFWAFVPAPDHVLSGPVVLRGRASGSINAPTLEGGAVLTGGRYQHLDFGTLLTNLNAQADFTRDGRVVFSADSNDGVTGTVNARGSYVVADGTIDSELTLNRAALVRRDDLTAIISGNATAKSTGRGRDIAVAGAFRTDFVELRLIGGYGSGLVVVDAIPVGETAPLYVEPAEDSDPQRISLDVSLDFPQQVFVRGRGLESEWGGQITATGYASSPRLNGIIQKRRGWLDLLGRQFELSIGEVRFTGPLDPFIRIRLQRQANDITGWLDVTGPASDLEIGFGSIPALSPDEVLPRLLFGRSKQSLSGLEAAQLAAGVATLLSGKESALDSVRGALGVDVLRVEGGEDDGTSVSTGKYLAPGVFVGAKQNITTGQSAAIVEIEVFDNIEIEAELGAEESKASGSWKLDY